MKNKSKRIVKTILILFFSFLLIQFGYSCLTKQNISKDLTNDSNNIDLSQHKTYDDVSILQYESGTTLSRLKLLAKEDSRINDIIENYNAYPEALLEALSRNIELVPFVINYFSKKDKVYSDNIGKINEKIPRLYQYDERWGYGKYGSSNVALSGCGPTALAMVVAGLKQDNTITPYKVAKLAETKGYYVENVGTSWDLMTKGAKDYGINVKELPLSKASIYEALEKGHPIICSMRKGDFTINGHYIVLVKVEDGKIKVNDPYSQVRSSILWDFERIKSQIKNLWEFYL